MWDDFGPIFAYTNIGPKSSHRLTDLLLALREIIHIWGLGKVYPHSPLERNPRER